MRIWVARPEPGGTRTGERLAALGHRALVAPVLVVSPTRIPCPSGTFDGLLITSANAATALHEADRHRFAGTPTFAVGARTGAIARAAGFADVRVAPGDAAALATLVARSLPPRSRLLLAAGAQRKAEPAATLAASGFALTLHVAYRAERVEALPDRVRTALDGDGVGPLDAVLHYSRRSAEAARDLAEMAGRSGAFHVLTHYCLSADVAAPLAAAGIAVAFVPGRPSEDALLAGLPKPG